MFNIKLQLITRAQQTNHNRIPIDTAVQKHQHQTWHPVHKLNNNITCIKRVENLYIKNVMNIKITINQILFKY